MGVEDRRGAFSGDALPKFRGQTVHSIEIYFVAGGRYDVVSPDGFQAFLV